MKKFVFWNLLVLFLVPVAALFAASLVLYNDSPNVLTAEVLGADGSSLGVFEVKPGEQKNFIVDLSRSQLKTYSDPTNSITPYSVVWRCSYKGIYSVSNRVSPGAMVRASAGQGMRYCEAKPEEKEKQECPPCPVCPKGSK